MEDGESEASLGQTDQVSKRGGGREIENYLRLIMFCNNQWEETKINDQSKRGFPLTVI